MVAAETRQSAGDAMAELRGSRAGVARLGRANGILTAASASFRGQARPGTALVVACVDGFRDRSRGGPACGAPARGVLEVHAGFFMAVYGCRKTRARSSAQGRDPAGTGRGRVMDVVREPGVGGVRRGGTPVTTRPARGAGGGPGLAGLVVRGGAPGPAARGRHRLRAHGQRTLRLHGEPADVLARGLAGRSCATAMDTGGGAAGAGTGGIMGPPRMAARTVSCAVPAMARGASASCTPPGSGNPACLPRPARPATRTAMAGSADGAYRTLVWRHEPFRDPRDPESATFRWVSWRGPEASAPAPGLQDTGTDRNRVLREPSGASRTTIRAEQKSGHIIMIKVREKI